MEKQVNSCILNKHHMREKKKIHKFQRRAGFTDKHHLRPGKETIPSNLLEMDAYRHDAWHFFFGHLTLNEIIYLLRCLKRAKKSIFSNMIWVLLLVSVYVTLALLNLIFLTLTRGRLFSFSRVILPSLTFFSLTLVGGNS